MIVFLFTVLVAVSSASVNPEGIIDLIPEDIINMIVDLIKTIDFEKVWELTKLFLCGEESLVEERGADFTAAAIRVVRYAICGNY
ncbi:hypothetical protein ACHWQZ_G018591 [Mnemiopsis leidyi]